MRTELLSPSTYVAQSPGSTSRRVGQIVLRLQQLTEPTECYFCKQLVTQAVSCVDGIRVCAKCANIDDPAEQTTRKPRRPARHGQVRRGRQLI